MSQSFYDAGEPANGQKVMLATPVYENPSASYTFSIQRSKEALRKAGIGCAYLLLSGNCHVDDARNSIVQEFLLSDCTDLIFLDADVCWEPSALVTLCGFDADVVGGVYPYRSETEKMANRLPVFMYPENQVPDENGLIEVAGLPTGFMRIRRRVLETLYQKAIKFWNRSERRSQVGIIFERTFLQGVRLGGDINFCRKWIEEGGKVYAAPEIRLGHTAKSIVYDSLGASLRRRNGTALKRMVELVKAGAHDPWIFDEARHAVGNRVYGAEEGFLSISSIMARKVDGPIIEAGSGLSSVVLGASTKEDVFCLEHDPIWALKTERMVEETGLKNVHVIRSEIKGEWYLPSKDLPKQFAFGLNDGPPRQFGDRMRFFDHFGDTPSILCDDANEADYASKLTEWCSQRGRRLDFIERAAIIR